MKAIVGLALVLGMSSASAQIYKWVDKKGVTHYSDTPVSSRAAPVGPPPAVPASVAMPYELALAARNHPVTLYTATACPACDQGRDFLKRRGIAFVEKTVGSDADEARLKEAGSDGRVPLLLVGRTKLLGFQGEDWSAALNAAAYPKRTMLPKAYRHQVSSAADPMVIPAAPPPATAPEPAPPRTREEPRISRPDLPPGFQF